MQSLERMKRDGRNMGFRGLLRFHVGSELSLESELFEMRGAPQDVEKGADNNVLLKEEV